MNQIGFENFRRFKNLTPKDLGNITILVGANNAGKSTLVKGLLLILDNIRSMRVSGSEGLGSQLPEFRFDANEYHDLGIGTFKRALYNKRDKDEISFYLRLTGSYNVENESGVVEKRNADFSFTFFVSGDASTDQTTGSITRLLVRDNTRQVAFDFNYNAGTTLIEFSRARSSSSNIRKSLEKRIAAIESELENNYNESKMLKAQIAEKQASIKDFAASEASLQERQVQLSREYAEYANYMAIADASSPESIKEMEEVSKRMESIKEQLRELSLKQAQVSETNLKEVISKLNRLSNNTLVKIAEKNAELDKLRKSLEIMVADTKEKNKPTRIELENDCFLDVIGLHSIYNHIMSIIYYSDESASIPDGVNEDSAEFESWQNKEADKAFIHEREKLLTELSEDLSFIIGGISAEYISAHSASQNVFYDTANKNDYFAKVIHRFHRNKIVEGSIAQTFVKTWMKRFEIGDDFKIESYGGEAYRFYIYEGNERMDLADKGMGANQLMILLISLASIIRDSELGLSKPFIIIEEPEQNLHPALQSRLIELLTEANRQFGFNFIIETHSEYMVRKAQVFVGQDKYKDDKDAMSNSPYAVYYFPKEGEPYQMQFRKNGKFSNEFGAGFFDEAANLAFEIF